MSDLLVELRPEGLYVPAGDFHIDPVGPVARAVITHAHGDHARGGCGGYWAAAEGLDLLRERLGKRAAITPVTYGTRFRLGGAEVSFHSAGHVLGSAQVRVEVAGEVWVVSGDYKRDADPTCTPFEPVRCDTFVTEATFASPRYRRWPDPKDVAGEIFAWWQAAKRDGQSAVLFCYALGKTQRVLAELAAFTGETVYVHSAMPALIKAYRKAGIRMLPTAAIGDQRKGTGYTGRLILAPPGAGGTPWMKRFHPCTTGFASGWMQGGDDGGRRLRYDRGFVLSDHADWDSLLRTIEETGARRVRIMHGRGEALIAHLQALGIDAAMLETASGITVAVPL